MPVYQYGTTAIEWEFQEALNLKRHTVTVERGKPVLLRGPEVPDDEKEELIRYRALWIKQRLAEVNQPLKDAFVTGSRLLYRGKTWYCVVEPAKELSQAQISFDHSRFLFSRRKVIISAETTCGLPVRFSFERRQRISCSPAFATGSVRRDWKLMALACSSFSAAGPVA